MNKQPVKMRWPGFGILILVGSWMVAACNGNSPAQRARVEVETPISASSSQPTLVPTIEATKTESVNTEASATEQRALETAAALPTPVPPTLTEVPLPTETEVVLEKPTPRVGLHASDPTTVQLVSGNLQLVEFFAFW